MEIVNVVFAIRRQKRHAVLIRKHINNRRSIQQYKNKMRQERGEFKRKYCRNKWVNIRRKNILFKGYNKQIKGLFSSNQFPHYVSCFVNRGNINVNYTS